MGRSGQSRHRPDVPDPTAASRLGGYRPGCDESDIHRRIAQAALVGSGEVFGEQFEQLEGLVGVSAVVLSQKVVSGEAPLTSSAFETPSDTLSTAFGLP